MTDHNTRYLPESSSGQAIPRYDKDSFLPSQWLRQASLLFAPQRIAIMNLEFNKNEEVLKQSLSDMRRGLEKIYEGGGKKAYLRRGGVFFHPPLYL
ncbi:MAG: hypothetical protein SGI83_16000 [Bacteroidota bacterium]|nr:hypothetical protein [Bacteroidota bacterium]